MFRFIPAGFLASSFYGGFFGAVMAYYLSSLLVIPTFFWVGYRVNGRFPGHYYLTSYEVAIRRMISDYLLLGDGTVTFMRIPRRIKVGPFFYEIQRPQVIDRYNPEVDGVCDYASLTIKIEAGLSGPRAEEVLLHEIIHAVNAFMQVELSERQTSLLSNGLFMVLKENGFIADGGGDDEGKEE